MFKSIVYTIHKYPTTKITDTENNDKYYLIFGKYCMSKLLHYIIYL